MQGGVLTAGLLGKSAVEFFSQMKICGTSHNKTDEDEGRVPHASPVQKHVCRALGLKVTAVETLWSQLLSFHRWEDRGSRQACDLRLLSFRTAKDQHWGLPALLHRPRPRILCALPRRMTFWAVTRDSLTLLSEFNSVQPRVLSTCYTCLDQSAKQATVLCGVNFPELAFRPWNTGTDKPVAVPALEKLRFLWPSTVGR